MRAGGGEEREIMRLFTLAPPHQALVDVLQCSVVKSAD